MGKPALAGSGQAQASGTRPVEGKHCHCVFTSTIAREERIRKLLPLELTPFDEAARRALA